MEINQPLQVVLTADTTDETIRSYLISFQRIFHSECADLQLIIQKHATLGNFKVTFGMNIIIFER